MPVGPAAGVTRHAAKLAGALACAALGSNCAFRNDVTVGGDEPASGGGAIVIAGAGHGGSRALGGIGGAHSGGHGAEPPTFAPEPGACRLDRQNITGYITPHDSADAMGEGSGGDLWPGVYRLVALVEHGSCGCFDANVPLAQTLTLDGENGSLVSDTDSGVHWGVTFAYMVRGNAFVVMPKCFESQGAPTGDPFGRFVTYTADDESLWLISPACRYRAAYRRLPIPPAR